MQLASHKHVCVFGKTVAPSRPARPRPVLMHATEKDKAHHDNTQHAPDEVPTTSREQQHASPAPSSPSPSTALRPPSPTPVLQNVDEEVPFVEPLLRSLVLGLGAGFLTELAHVLVIAGGAAMHSGAGLAAFPASLHTPHPPLLTLDLTVAAMSWVMLYLIEARTVWRILEENPNSHIAAKQINRTPTLPKTLMPLSLNSAKKGLYRLLRGPSTPAVAGAVSGGAAVASSSGKGGVGATHTSSSGSNMSSRNSSSLALGFRGNGPGEPGLMERPAAGSGQKPPSDKVPPKPVKQNPTLQTPSDSRITNPMSGNRRGQQIDERRTYLRNFWYAAALSENVKVDQPVETMMLGRKVALLRDAEGFVHAFDNVCPHRGAPLAKGWVKDLSATREDGSKDASSTETCLVCPYHGWAFGTDGKLKEAPSTPDQEHLPKRQLVEMYPVEERGGFVWLFFGSKSLPPDERPPIPFISELEDPEWQCAYGELEFDVPWWSVFDNAIDMSHIHYVHSDSFGNQDKPELRDMKVNQYTYHCDGTFRIHNKPVNPLWNWTAVEIVPVHFAAFLPSTSAVMITLGRGVQMITFVNTVPIDEHRCVNRYCLVRNFAGWSALDIFAQRAMDKILNQDKDMVEVCEPEKMRAEVSLEADLPQVAFRKLRQEWLQLGYGVPPESTTGHNGTLSPPPPSPPSP